MSLAKLSAMTPGTPGATSSSSTPRGVTPALDAEVKKVEHRQKRNSDVTMKAIDRLSERISVARRELEKAREVPGVGKEASDKSLGEILANLTKECEGTKAVDSMASEHKNFHATISKLAKAAEKVRRAIIGVSLVYPGLTGTSLQLESI